jgi:lambda repressor-like predicted transcriptional regulator
MQRDTAQSVHTNTAQQLNISVNNKKSILPYAKACTLHIKKLMVEHEMTYDDIVAKLEERGVVLSSSNLRNKVSGNALSAGLFFLMVEIITDDLHAHINVKGQ